MISSFVFHDHLTVVNILGLFITLAGIGFYHFMKLREMKAQSMKAAREIADLNLATAVNQHAMVRDHRRKRRSGSGRNSGSQQEARTTGTAMATARRGGFEEPSSVGRTVTFEDDIHHVDEADQRGKTRSRDSDDGNDGGDQEQLILGLEASPDTHRGGA